MTRETASIQSLLAAAEQSIPNLDGHNIRVAERRIIWSKIAQVPAGPTAEQIAAWNKPTNEGEAKEQAKYQGVSMTTPVAPTNSPVLSPADRAALWAQYQGKQQPAIPAAVTPQQRQELDLAAWKQQNPEDELGQLLRRPTRQQPAPQGVAHVQRPAPRPTPKPVAPAAKPVAKPVPQFDLRQTMDSPTGILPPETYTPGPGDENYSEPLVYTPGPNDPNYTGASKSIKGLVRVANYLSKKAAGQTFEQAQAAYQKAGGDTLNAGKGQYGQVDTSKAQYEAILNTGSYLPEGSDDISIEIRAAIQGGRAVGVTVITANPKMSGLIDNAVRALKFPVNQKMDFVITKF